LLRKAAGPWLSHLVADSRKHPDSTDLDLRTIMAKSFDDEWIIHHPLDPHCLQTKAYCLHSSQQSSGILNLP
jgi:hypothetical protein